MQGRLFERDIFMERFYTAADVAKDTQPRLYSSASETKLRRRAIAFAAVIAAGTPDLPAWRANHTNAVENNHN